MRLALRSAPPATDSARVTSDDVRLDTQRARRRVVAASVVLLLALLAAGLFVARSEAEQKQALTERFDARQATASLFLEA